MATTKYEIIYAWCNSPRITEEQFDTIFSFVNDRLICSDDKERDDILSMVTTEYNKRSFMISKAMHFKKLYSEPQPTDNV